MRTVFPITLALFGLAACTGTAQHQAAYPRPCDQAGRPLEAGFPAARMNECVALSDREMVVTILPEDQPPINESPWYAFRVAPHDDPIRIDVVYRHAPHRYWPKISYDGAKWTRLSDTYVWVSGVGDTLRMEIPASDTGYVLAAQEIRTSANHRLWSEELATKNGVRRRLLGNSVQGRPIHALESFASAPGHGRPRPVVFLVGRQHPPEVTGALALTAFVETVFSDTALAGRFRDVFDIFVAPNLNPDGVEGGHWRHNTQGTDLNRDWGPFTQPETQLMRDELDALAADSKRDLWLLIDFHSTYRNLLYTQFDEDEVFLPGFTGSWIEAAALRLPSSYKVSREPRRTTDLPTSKNYIHRRFRVPAITYEVGDETGREAIDAAAIVYAEEMMRYLLDAHDNGASAPEAGP